MKVCIKCKQEKPLDGFSKDSRRKDGKQPSCKECQKAYHKANMEVRNARRREQWHETSATTNTKRRVDYSKDSTPWMLTQARRRAKKQGVPFNLVLEDLEIPKLCPVLNIPLVIGKEKMSDSSPTLDKHIPKLGYVKGNISIMSLLANRIKNNGTSEQVAMVASWMKQQEDNKDEQAPIDWIKCKDEEE